MRIPTEAQLRVLAYIHDYIELQGVPPTLREIAKGLGWSKGPQTWFVDPLVRTGCLRKTASDRRFLVPTHYGMFKLREAFGEQYDVCDVVDIDEVAFDGKRGVA